MSLPSFFSIAQVAEITGVNQATLRSWEKAFPQLKPRRSTGGTRRYTQKEVDLINHIKSLLNGGYNIAGVQKVLKSKDIDAVLKRQTVINKLEKLRQELLDIRLELNEGETFVKEFIVPGNGDDIIE